MLWSNVKKELWQWRGVLIAAPSVAIAVILIRALGLLQILELGALDQLFILRPEQKPNDQIVIVEINESDIQYAKQWPMTDATLAKLLDNIRKQKPVAIGLDLYRDLPLEPGHKELVEIYKTTPNLIGIQKVVGDVNSSAVKPIPELKEKGQIASNDIILDPDGKVRRALIYFDTKDEKNQDVQVLSLATRLAYMYLQPKVGDPQFPENKENPEEIKMIWGKATFTKFMSLDVKQESKKELDKIIPVSEQKKIDLMSQIKTKITKSFLETKARFSPRYINKKDGGYESVSDQGYQVMINYNGAARKSFKIISMKDVLENKGVEQLQGKIVVIGATAESLKDLFYTPYSGTFSDSPEIMSGAEIHANIISQIINSVLEKRALIKTNPEWQEWLAIFGASIIGASLTWITRSTTGKKQSSLQVLSIVFVAGGIILTGYFAFLDGLWIPIVPPLVGLLGSAFAVTNYIAKSAGDIRETFGRYLTDEVVSTLLENPEGLKLGGERRKITILTSDLRGFTATAERLPPEDVVKILNIYLGYMADIITKYNGTIDEFMGDGILVLFGAPTARIDDPERAVACALDMQLSMAQVNKEMEAMGLSPLKMGIGINTGEVVVGNIGSAKRTKYGVVGSQVNLTYRVESYTTEGQILISQTTLEEIKTELRIDGEKKVTPKGVIEPITIYDIGGIKGKYNLELIREEQVYLPLEKEISVSFATLEGKDISENVILGTLVKLSAKCAELKTDGKLKGSTNIKMNLLNVEEGAEFSTKDDIYAKVLDKMPDNGNFYVFFTAMPPKVEAMFQHLYKSLTAKDAK